MQKDKVVIYLHLVWTTWDRLPLIEDSLQNALYDCLAATAKKHGCRVVAINGTQDHVHVLISLVPTQAVSTLLQQLKGVSSHFLNERMGGHTFKWRGSYAVYSVSRWDVSKVAGYIRNQKQHHDNNTTRPQLEMEDDE